MLYLKTSWVKNTKGNGLTITDTLLTKAAVKENAGKLKEAPPD
jgi:hypothetical protein